jgi:hypothetical protein
MSQYFDEKDLFLQPQTTQVGSHMIMSNVQKQVKTKLVNLDTKFRDDYQYDQVCNYNITLPERINEVKSIEVKSVELPLSFYNISANLGNNYFKVSKYSDSTTFALVDISDGYYTSSTLITAFDTAIANLSNSYFHDLSLNIDNGIASFKTTASLNTYVVEFDVDSTGATDKFHFTTKLGWLLGFRQKSYNITTLLNKYAENVVDLTNPRYLYLAIEEFNKGNQKSFITPLSGFMVNKNVIARLQLNHQLYPNKVGTSVTVLPLNQYNGLLSDIRTYTGKVDLQKINVQLLSETGIPMDLNGLDFSFTLKVHHEA